VKHRAAFRQIRVPMTRTLGVRPTENRIQAAPLSEMCAMHPPACANRIHDGFWIAAIGAQAGPRKASCHEAKRHRWGVTGLGVVEMSGDVVELELAI